MKKVVLASLIGTLSLSSVTMANQQTSPVNHNWSVGVGIGTLGVNGNVAYKFNNTFKLRGVVNYLQINRKFNNDVHVDARLRLLTAGLNADWHLLKNGFRVTAGVLYNGNRLKSKFSSSSNINVNGRTYTPAQIGEVRGTLDFRKISPYVGIGYDSHHEATAGFAFNADLGILFQGKARGKIDSITGQIANNAQSVEDMKTETLSTVNKSRWLKTYPVASIGISYKF